MAADDSRLDRSLGAAIRAPVVDERFDEQVWARIRADEAAALATQRLLRMRLGTPWWLAALNVIAMAAVAVTIAVALGASRPVAESAAVVLALAEQPPESVRSVALLVAAAALWFGLRRAPFLRAWL